MKVWKRLKQKKKRKRIEKKKHKTIKRGTSTPTFASPFLQIGLALNQHKDHSKRTVEVLAGAPPGSLYTLQCQRGLNYNRQHPNALTRSRILAQMMEMEPVQR